MLVSIIIEKSFIISFLLINLELAHLIFKKQAVLFSKDNFCAKMLHDIPENPGFYKNFNSSLTIFGRNSRALQRVYRHYK